MDASKLGETLAKTLPAIKTRLQLTGLGLVVVLAVLTNFAKPGDTVAMMSAGSVGVSLIVFAQLFHFLGEFRLRDRAMVFLAAFGMFAAFTLAMTALTIFLVLHKPPAPSMSITPFEPSPEMDKASTPNRTSSIDPVQPARLWLAAYSDATTADTKAAPAKIIALPPYPQAGHDQRDARDAEYVYSEPGDVPTLRAKLKYSEFSRAGAYPDGDFHSAVGFGSPWLRLNMANPTKSNLFFTTLRVEALRVQQINEVILQTPEQTFTPGHTTWEFVNEGWGKALRAKLNLKFARALDNGRYQILADKTYALGDVGDGAKLNLAADLPPRALWRQMPQDSGCKPASALTLIGRLDYVDEAGKPMFETFRAPLYWCSGSGGGNIGPSAAYNITLPDSMSGFPLNLGIGTCIAANSADSIVLKFTARRSAHYDLNIVLKATSGETLNRKATLDVLVPRKDYVSLYPGGSFFEAKGKAGCT